MFVLLDDISFPNGRTKINQQRYKLACKLQSAYFAPVKIGFDLRA
jgi:hypothetical protein